MGRGDAAHMKSKNYEEFVDKFKPKKTTDDCYTHPEIYEVILNWVCREYGYDFDDIVRPFWPGGDYTKENYPEDCLVLDNPPFSILSKICEFYLERGIKFFLFAPSLTCLSSRKTWNRICHMICDCDIIYANGAVVRTSFVTNCENDIVAKTMPELSKRINFTTEKLRREKTRKLPKYEYPDYLVTAAMMQKYARYGIEFKIKKEDCMLVSRLDAQKEEKKNIFGCGLLLSEKAAAEKAAATRYALSAREKEIVAALG